MHDGVDPPVDQAVFGLEAGYPERAGGVVSPTAAIRSGEATQLGVLARRVALAAPFRARNTEYIRNVATTSKKEFSGVSKECLSSDVIYLGHG